MRATFTICLAALLSGLVPAVSNGQQAAERQQVASPSEDTAVNPPAPEVAKLRGELARTLAVLQKAQQAERPNRATIERLEKKAAGLREQLGVTDSAGLGRCPFGGSGPMGGQFGRGPGAGLGAGASSPGAGQGRPPAGSGAAWGCPCGRCPWQATDIAPQAGMGRGPMAGSGRGGAGRGGPRGGGYGRGAGYGRGGAR